MSAEQQQKPHREKDRVFENEPENININGKQIIVMKVFREIPRVARVHDGIILSNLGNTVKACINISKSISSMRYVIMESI